MNKIDSQDRENQDLRDCQNSDEYKPRSITVEFTTTKYESIKINDAAATLLKKFRVFANSMNFCSGYKADTKLDDTTLNVKRDANDTIVSSPIVEKYDK